MRATIILLVLVGLGPSALALAQTSGPLVGQEVKHDLSAPLRDIPPTPPPAFSAVPRPTVSGPGPQGAPAPDVDPVVQTGVGPQAMPAPLQSFEGIKDGDTGTGGVPPDTNGDVGPNHYVQQVNAAFAVYSKAGALLMGPRATNDVWVGFGGACETSNDGDGIVLYDSLADRWVISQFALPTTANPPWYECIAVSTTGDPTGSYHRYQFDVTGTVTDFFPDYPKLAVWPDGYYLAAQRASGRVSVVAFERAAMLNGNPAQQVAFLNAAAQAPFDTFGLTPMMLPADLDGPAPPAGTPNFYVQFIDNAWDTGIPSDLLQVFQFQVNWTTPANSTFTGPAPLAGLAPFDSNLCNYTFLCVPQPNTTQKLDPISEWPMYRLQYRHFNTHGTLVLNHTVDTNNSDHHGIRWYELRNDGGSGAWTIQQQGTYAPDGEHRWMGSAAMDQDGDIALGFSLSSSSTFPSIRYAGRLSTDPAGQLSQGEATLIAGGGSQTGIERWGDYGALAVDPTDGCTFWYTTEYYSTTNGGNWRTRIGAFKFPSCGSAGSNPSAAAFIVDHTGTVSADGSYSSGSGGFNSGSGADLAEGVESLEPLLPGEVVELDLAHPGYFRRSRGGPAVAGVISTRPGMALANGADLPGEVLPLGGLSLAHLPDPGPLSLAGVTRSTPALRLSLSLGELAQLRARPLLALAGRVPVWASSENGPIRPGDLLVPSATRPGYAMRCGQPCAAPIIGKALEPLMVPTGLVEMLVMRP